MSDPKPPTTLGEAIAEHYRSADAERRQSESDQLGAGFVPDTALEANLRLAETDPEMAAEIERLYDGDLAHATYRDARAAAIASGRFDPTTGKLKEPQ